MKCIALSLRISVGIGGWRRPIGPGGGGTSATGSGSERATADAEPCCCTTLTWLTDCCSTPLDCVLLSRSPTSSSFGHPPVSTPLAQYERSRRHSRRRRGWLRSFCIGRRTRSLFDRPGAAGPVEQRHPRRPAAGRQRVRRADRRGVRRAEPARIADRQTHTGFDHSHKPELGSCSRTDEERMHRDARSVEMLCTSWMADWRSSSCFLLDQRIFALVRSFVGSFVGLCSHGDIPDDVPFRFVGALHGQAGRVAQARQEAHQRRRESAVATRRHPSARAKERGTARRRARSDARTAQQTDAVDSGCVGRLQGFVACALANRQCGGARSVDRIRRHRRCCDSIRRCTRCHACR